MTWVRLDEAFAQHPKVAKVGPLGMALHVAALCYCNTYLTDGHVPTAAARTLIDLEDFGGSKQVIKDLVSNGLWEEVADGYQLHDYLEYQPTKQQVIDLRSKKQAAGIAGGQASAKAKRVAKSNPVPVPGSVTEPNTDSVSAPLSKRVSPPAEDDADFDHFWQTYPRHHSTGKPGGGGSRSQTLDKWRRLKDSERQACLVAVRHYADALNQPDAPFAAAATTWLNQKRWQDWLEPADLTQARGPAPPRDRFAEMAQRFQQRQEVGDGQANGFTDATRRGLPA